MPTDPRAALDALIRDRGQDYAGLSRLLGRNPAYIQQFIKRGSPRRLEERDRATLARFFGVEEAVLGGAPVAPAPAPDALVPVPMLPIAASAGPGAVPGGEGAATLIGFDRALLRSIAPGSAQSVSLIQVEGDSMAPTLGHGDVIMVDAADGAGRLRDGIYVLRHGDVLNVKRITLAPDGFTVSSDNPDHPPWTGSADALHVVGRVVWVGRRLA